MSSVVDPPVAELAADVAVAPRTVGIRVALLGTGTVGSAVIARIDALRQRGIAVPHIAWLANSRGAFDCGNGAGVALRAARMAPQRSTATDIVIGRVRGIADGRTAASYQCVAAVFDATVHASEVVIDATASDAVAARHADWLGRGVHVVTANKLGAGAALARAQAIAQAQRRSSAHYGDAATVGAGLPLLRSIRELVAGGDRIHAVEGVLSGSLAWLFTHFDGSRPFSTLVREACDAGYTEPDPRLDLSGEDVRRKLLILARAAGMAMDSDAIAVDSLLPQELSSDASLDDALSALDAPMAARLRAAARDGSVLHVVGRIDSGGAHVSLQDLPRHHALCGSGGTDNRVAISSDRYREQPLVIQGPGAGAEITAAALIDDVLRIARSR